MKQLLFYVLVVSTVACGKSDKAAGDKPAGDKPAGDKPAAGAGACLVGTYVKGDEPEKKFIFRADGTATEIYEAGKDERPIKWTAKDDQSVHLTYVPHDNSVGGEFDMNYSCEKGTFATLYKKQ